ncbi:MAG: DNA-processing protein DprA [Planctomycetota bacterium]|nr:MAG: DNA-processing protein DprA [Planctomycetota bacterium]
MTATVQCQDILGPLDEVARKHAPDALYIAGDEKLLHGTSRVSIVGSRKASEVGLKRAARLTRELVKARVVIVSGLAKGIDHTAHTTAIEAGGRTIAVIGTPLDRAYPKEHAELQAQIARDHLLVSQFPVGAATGAWSFPVRNRTMALLSHATVIVEASEDSGSLHQGWEAIRLGRPLFFMVSLLESPDLAWPRKLMEYGAQPLSSVEELLAEIPAADFTPAGLDAF